LNSKKRYITLYLTVTSSESVVMDIILYIQLLLLKCFDYDLCNVEIIVYCGCDTGSLILREEPVLGSKCWGELAGDGRNEKSA
jgi:hypothetical protein